MGGLDEDEVGEGVEDEGLEGRGGVGWGCGRGGDDEVDEGFDIFRLSRETEGGWVEDLERVGFRSALVGGG